jgi:tRNA pseudouridine13 synthase
MTAEACASAAAALDEIRHLGCPDYFDDQRFGSVVSGGEFIGRLMVRGDFEGALRLALAAPYEYDRAEQKKEKAILTAHWGDWPACKEKLPRGHARSLVDYLVHHPGDYRGTVARLRPELRGLYLSAYQSHLWNRMLAWTLRRHCRPEQLLPWHCGWARCRSSAPSTTNSKHASGRDPAAAVGPTAPRTSRSVRGGRAGRDGGGGAGIAELRVKGIRELFFSKGERPAAFVPSTVSCETADDERNAGRKKVVLRFELPRGCYATLIVKRIGHPSPG